MTWYFIYISSSPELLVELLLSSCTIWPGPSHRVLTFGLSRCKRRFTHTSGARQLLPAAGRRCGRFAHPWPAGRLATSPADLGGGGSRTGQTIWVSCWRFLCGGDELTQLRLGESQWQSWVMELTTAGTENRSAFLESIIFACKRHSVNHPGSITIK